MSIERIKTSKPETDRAEDDTKVRGIVEAGLKDIESRGDAAVREMSQKFDNYAPESFRLTQGEIEGLMSRVSARDMEDIKFAQTQVMNFARAQRDSMRPCHPGCRKAVLMPGRSDFRILRSALVY